MWPPTANTVDSSALERVDAWSTKIEEAMTNSFGIDIFRKKWTAEFKKWSVDEGRSSIADDFWDGNSACKELRRKHHLPDYSDQPIVIPHARLFREAETYLRFANKVVPHNQDFSDTLHFLTEAERWFIEGQKSLTLRAMVDQFNEIACLLREKRLAIQAQRENYWSEVLLASPDERDGWYLDLETQVLIPPDELVRTEHIFEKARYPKELTRRSDLDSRFQIRLGTILRHFMAGVSLRTIARLTVLCYICADLVEVDSRSNNLVIKQLKDSSTRNQLTVDAVYQKLRSGGLR
jgi:hypothetical protein